MRLLIAVPLAAYVDLIASIESQEVRTNRLACLAYALGRIISLIMHRIFLIAMLMTAFVLPFAENGPQSARVVAIKKHPQGRIAHWEGRTPVFDGNPVYDITLHWNNKKYMVRYESLTGYYPKAWDIGSEIRVKRERGQFLLYRGDEAVPAREISSHDCVQALSPEGPASVTPQVPCD